MPKQDEVLRLQDDITREVTGDAEDLAGQIFPTRGPDMSHVDNATLDRVYRSKFEAQDRKWLQAEARRDPEQFLKVAERLNVKLPPTSVPGQIRPAPDASAIQPPPQVAPQLPPGPLPASVQPAPQLPIPLVPQAPVLPPPPTVPTVPQVL